MTSVYRRIEDFYQERGGAQSGECDFGAWWYDVTPAQARYRVSVVHDTGDVYAKNHYDGSVELLGTLEHVCQPVADDETFKRSLTWHDTSCAYTRAEEALMGWSDGGQKPLSWARERLQSRAAAPAVGVGLDGGDSKEGPEDG